MAHVEKRGPGRWRARYRGPDGRERSQTFDRKLDADRWLASIEGEKVRGSYVDPSAGRQTFLAFADEWAESQDWKATTAESWTYVRARLEPLVGARPWRSTGTATSGLRSRRVPEASSHSLTPIPRSAR